MNAHLLGIRVIRIIILKSEKSYKSCLPRKAGVQTIAWCEIKVVTEEGEGSEFNIYLS
jgi:hypothetical protein